MDIFKFPFIAEIWGTVSDWVMIAVTSITAIFLYKTLQSQKDVQKAQNRVLEIEQIRLREQFKPNLKYFPFQDSYSTKPENYYLKINVKNISSNQALNVKPIFKKTHHVTLEHYQGSNLINDTDSLLLYFVIDVGEPITYNFHFIIKYQDITGINYKQEISCWQNDDNIQHIDPSIPETNL